MYETADQCIRNGQFMKKNLIKKQCLSAMLVGVMACFSACSFAVAEVEEEIPKAAEQEKAVEVQVVEESTVEEDSQTELTDGETELSEQEIAAVLEEFDAYLAEISAETEEKHKEEQAESSYAPSGFDRGKAEEAFSKVNEQRNINGVSSLAWDETLYELACVRAQELVSSFSHQRPDGSYVGDVIIGQYGASGCGENVAAHYKSVTNLINGWLNSEGHKENLLDSRFTAGVMACYCHEGSYYWVNLFKQ